MTIVADALKRTRKGRRAIGAAFCLAVLSANMPAARADVLEIGEDGSVAVRAGSGVIRWQGGAAEDIGAVTGLPDVAMTGTTASRVPAPYSDIVERLSAKYDLSPALVEALVWQESRWRADAVSPAGAVGLGQLMPGTARSLGVDPRDPVQNLDGAARYLRTQLDLFGGDIEKALAAYNAGPARVMRTGGVPPIAETRAYVAAVIGRLSTLPQ